MPETLYIGGTLSNGNIIDYRIAFTMADSSQLEYETSVSLDGSEMRSDELYITLRCRESVVTVSADALPDFPGLVVTDYAEFRTVNDETFLTAGDDVFKVPVTADLAEIWLGMFRGVGPSTPVWYDNGAGRLEKYYWKSMKRVAKYDFELTVQSPVGRLTSKFEGGVYNGEPLSSVLYAVIGGIPVLFDGRLNQIGVYGWLPYRTRRECLHILSIAYGFIILRDENRDLFFTLPPSDAAELPDSVIYDGGSVDYRIGETYARADVTEYEFLKTSNSETVTLFDNTGGTAVTGHRVIFSDAPVYNLTVSGNLRIDDKEDGLKDCGPNYAVVTGVGVLKARAYMKVSGVASFAGDPAADPERVLTVENIPVITSLNSATVAAKYLSSANASAVVEMDFIRGTQNAGDLLSFADPYGATRTGYLLSMSGKVTSIDRVAARFLCGYTHHWGNTYNVVIPLTGAGIWTVPENLDSETIRIVLISGGNGGESGQHGTDSGADGRGDEIGGCAHGSPGAGGKINVIEIAVSAGETFSYQCGAGGAGGLPSGDYDTDENGRKTYRVNPGGTGGATIFGAYSSDSGAASEIGYYDIIHKIQYGLPGPDNGVGGGAATTATENENPADPQWTDVVKTYVEILINNLPRYSVSGDVGSGDHFAQDGDWAYGGLGGGAAVNANGERGADAPRRDTGGRGGKGANADALFPADTRAYGSGGSGGHGGGEGGRGGKGYTTDSENSYASDGARGVGGSGSPGQDGKAGCILIYYHN